jgi:hypothetical protein
LRSAYRHQTSAIRCEILISARDFVRIWQPLSVLRRALGSEQDVLTDPLHFLCATDATRRSCSVACWMGEELIGVVFATSHYALGVPTGYAIAGDFTGRGSVLCRPEHQSLVVESATRCMMQHGVHSLHLRISPAVDEQLKLSGLVVKQLYEHVPGDLIALPGSYDRFFTSLGSNTRRNIRRYTRRAAAAGIVFAGRVSASDYAAAVERLNRRSGFSVGAHRIARDKRLIELHCGEHFALRAANGQIVAALCGFSRNGRFHLLSQTNDAGLPDLSLSLVLRGFVIEHIIAAGHTELQFMGGSSLILGRFCAPLSYRSIFVDRPHPILTFVKRLASRIVDRLIAGRKHVPFVLELFCGSYLADSRLAERTALMPAAILRQQILARTPSPPACEPRIATLAVADEFEA